MALKTIDDRELADFLREQGTLVMRAEAMLVSAANAPSSPALLEPGHLLSYSVELGERAASALRAYELLKQASGAYEAAGLLSRKLATAPKEKAPVARTIDLRARAAKRRRTA